MAEPLKRPIDSASFNETEEHHRHAKLKKIILVVIITFFYTFAFILSFINFSQYIYYKIQKTEFPDKQISSSKSYCEVNKSSSDFEIQSTVQSKAANWQIYVPLAGNIVAIISNLLLGSFTDKMGRKFLFYVPSFGSIMREAAVACLIYSDVDLIYFMIPFALEGFTGKIFNTIQVAFMYTADLTSPRKQRAFGIVMVELALGLGTTLSGFVSGYFIQYEGFLWPSITAVVLFLASFLMVFFLPESYYDRNVSSASKIQYLKEAIGLYIDPSNAGKRWMYIDTILVFTFTMTDVFGRTVPETLYQLGPPFCWSPVSLGWFSALRSGFQQVVGMGMVKPLQRCMSNEAIAIMGSISFTIGWVMEALAKSDVMLYLVTLVGSGGLLTVPMIRAIMSCMTPADKQGAVFSTISAVKTACNLTSVFISNYIYSATLDFYPGTVFFVFALFNLISIILLVFFVIETKGRVNREYERIYD